jgi:hypothetical protein
MVHDEGEMAEPEWFTYLLPVTESKRLQHKHSCSDPQGLTSLRMHSKAIGNLHPQCGVLCNMPFSLAIP